MIQSTYRLYTFIKPFVIYNEKDFLLTHVLTTELVSYLMRRQVHVIHVFNISLI